MVFPKPKKAGSLLIVANHYKSFVGRELSPTKLFYFLHFMIYKQVGDVNF